MTLVHFLSCPSENYPKDMIHNQKGETMLRKSVSFTLVLLLLHLFLAASGIANTNDDKKADTLEKVKAGILKLGTGPDAKIEVKLYDKTKIKGYVRSVTPDHFVVLDAKTAAHTAIPYEKVKQIKGNNLSTGAKIAIGVGVILLLAIIIATQTK